MLIIVVTFVNGKELFMFNTDITNVKFCLGSISNGFGAKWV